MQEERASADSGAAGNGAPGPGISLQLAIEVVAAAILLFAGLLYQLSYYNCGLVLLDEGFLASLADRILHGEVIYRDFYTLAGPLPFYLVALLFKVFGCQLILIRWMFVILTLANAALAYLVVRRFTAWPFAAAAGAVLLVWNWLMTAPSAHNWMPEVLVLAGLLVTLHGVRCRRVGWFLLAGAFCGAATICKTTTGNLAVFALICSVGVIEGVGRSVPWRRKLLGPVMLLVGYAAIVLPTLLLLLCTAGPKALYLNLVKTPTESYTREAAVAYPGAYPATRSFPSYAEATWRAVTFRLPHMDAHDLAVHSFAYLPLLMYVIAGGVVVLLWRRSGSSTHAESWGWQSLLLLLLFAAITHLQVFPRADVAHLVAAVQPAVLLTAVLAGMAWRERLRSLEATSPGLRNAVGVIGLVILIAPFAAITKVGATRTGYMYALCDTELKPERARGIFLERDKAAELQSVVSEIRSQTQPSDRIFIAPSAAGIYFLSDRRNSTPFELCYNGPIGPGNVQELYAAVQESKPVLVVYGTHDFIDRRDFKDYARPVYDLLHTRKPVLVTENYEILK